MPTDAPTPAVDPEAADFASIRGDLRQILQNQAAMMKAQATNALAVGALEDQATAQTNALTIIQNQLIALAAAVAKINQPTGIAIAPDAPTTH